MTESLAPNESRVVPRWRAGRLLVDGSRIYWWREIIIVLVVNGIYESVRNFTAATPAKAYDNALRLIDWQKALGIWHEHGIQQWALNSTALIIVANYFYGSVYLGATIAALIYLYRVHPDDYPLWRNTLAIGTLLGLIGFATFPLMPPRLLDTMADGLGNGQIFGFVDTLVKYPTFWSFDSEAMKTISNQFAAMPSLHCGWSFWGFAVFYPRVRSGWARALAVLYPTLYEGFGRPALDAQAVGTPVLVSDVSSLRELVGPTSVALDPLDERGWLDACRAVIARRIGAVAPDEASRVWARQFSWAASAEAHWQVYRAVAPGIE